MVGKILGWKLSLDWYQKHGLKHRMMPAKDLEVPGEHVPVTIILKPNIISMCMNDIEKQTDLSILRLNIYKT